MKSFSLKRSSCLIVILILFVFGATGYSTAASGVTVQVNGGEEETGASLLTILRGYNYDQIHDLVVTGGTLTEADLDFLKNTSPESDAPDFSLPALRSLRIEKEVSLPSALPSYFMSKHPALEVVEIYSVSPVYVGEFAFSDCSGLVRAELDTACELGGSVFRNSSALTDVSLVQATNLGGNVFQGCRSLKTLAFGEIAPAEFTDDCFPLHEFTMLVPKGKAETYRSRCSHYHNIIFQETDSGTSPEPDVPGQTGNVALNGTAQASYTVSVTPSISFGVMKKSQQQARQTIQVSAEQMFLAEDQQLEAVVSSPSGSFTMQTKHNSKVSIAMIDANGRQIQNNDTFAVFQREGESKSADLVLNQNELPYAGDYTGNMTFEFMVNDVH